MTDLCDIIESKIEPKTLHDFEYNDIEMSNYFDSKAYLADDYQKAEYKYKIKMIKRLLENGANPNSEHQLESKALIRAIVKGYDEIVSLLLEYGAHPNARMTNVCPFTATGFMYAIGKGYDEIVSLLLKYGADPNARDCDGIPALICAIHKRYDKIVSSLLKHGANPNIKNAYGTALIHAVEHGHSKTVSLLLEYGANMEVLDSKGKTAFYYVLNPPDHFYLRKVSPEEKDEMIKIFTFHLRKPILIVYENCRMVPEEHQKSDEHILRYLLDIWVLREICTYMVPLENNTF